jgi:hypothetical protein
MEGNVTAILCSDFVSLEKMLFLPEEDCLVWSRSCAGIGKNRI